MGGASAPMLLARVASSHRIGSESVGPEGPPTKAFDTTDATARICEQGCSCGRGFSPDAPGSGRFVALDRKASGLKALPQKHSMRRLALVGGD
ncbi:DUF6053 domain-containing protein [Lysobacter enzymogenes]|uniref:DUF6053 domain-containing protein n=1 Tax=Lysobacter enzymogenes TaxID=69 RepID=UPI003D2F98E9